VRLTALVLALSLASANLGCGASVVIRPDDPVFARAQTRLTRTVARIEAARAPADQTALMLQAESLYRYRFAPPPRGFVSYAAEFAASAIEIPALQSLSGALDIHELRLRAPDGAVQLWESYLARYPGGELRPLALYRLGWAYRSTGAAGLPRKSGDEAFAQLQRESPGSPLAVLAASTQGLAWKSKDAASAWSAVPGLGQMYVGRYAAGTGYLLVGAAAAAMIITPLVVGYQRRHDLSWSDDWPLLALGIGGLLVLSLDYTAAYQDAIARVVDWNERIENAFEDAHPDAP
jgi:hypothetical protein